MSKHKKIKFTRIERRRIVVGRRVLEVMCPVCGVEVETVSEAEAADFLSLGAAGLESLVGMGRVHGVRTASGTLRICKHSLLDGGSEGVPQ